MQKSNTVNVENVRLRKEMEKLAEKMREAEQEIARLVGGV